MGPIPVNLMEIFPSHLLLLPPLRYPGIRSDSDMYTLVTPHCSNCCPDLYLCLPPSPLGIQLLPVVWNQNPRGWSIDPFLYSLHRLQIFLDRQDRALHSGHCHKLVKSGSQMDNSLYSYLQQRRHSVTRDDHLSMSFHLSLHRLL
jgi:hypothetical protein